ncbi:MAG: sulfite exporter TauE/SafE family protein [Pseudomonadota bacterium]|nr:sulfite exporter TauE/SafE family protein [Pseudomonadota bacterium]
MLSDPSFYLVAIPAVLCFGLAKGGLGGLAMLSVPLMALEIPPQQAAGILLPILCLMDVVAVWRYWGQWSLANLRVLVPAAMVGILAGAWLFPSLSEAQVRILIGAITAGFALLELLRRRPPRPRTPHPRWGRWWGAVSGFTSFGIHAGGPPLSLYLLPQRLAPVQYVGTTAAFFLCVNYAKLAPYWMLGQLETPLLTAALVLAPFAPLGVLGGAWIVQRLPAERYYNWMFILLLLTGLRLLQQGIQQALA